MLIAKAARLNSSVFEKTFEAAPPAFLVASPKPLDRVAPYAPTHARRTAVESSWKRYTPSIPPTEAAPMTTALPLGSSIVMAAGATREAATLERGSCDTG